MGRMNDQPFPRGGTWYGLGQKIPSFAGVTLTADNMPGGWNIEGKEYEFEDGAAGDEGTFPITGYNTGMYVTVRAVRNASQVNILPGQLCFFTTTYVDGVTVVPYGRAVGGYTTTLAQHGYPADEFLPPAGVAPNDLFYIVVDGPCLLNIAANNAAAITAGQKVVAQTAAGSTSTEAGQVIGQVINESTDTDNVANANQIQNAIGRAMSAAASTATQGGILVDVGWE
jgi:hypothetical protein